MYYFVFRTAAHYSWRSSTTQRESTFGKFKLEYLRKTFKSRFDMNALNSLKLQKDILEIERIGSTSSNFTGHRFYGHILTVQDEDDAVYLKLHPTGFVRTPTKLHEIYQNINPVIIDGFLNDIQKENFENINYRHKLNSSNATVRSIENLKGCFRDNVIPSRVITSEEYMRKMAEGFEEFASKTRENILQIHNDYNEYMKSCLLEV